MHDDKIIEIVYTCTGGYVNYTKPFLESLKYFFPRNRKIVRIISDGADEYKGYTDDKVIYVEVNKKPNLIYPCVPIHKMYWVNELPKMNSDYCFYFDADTIFKEVPDYNWEALFAKMDEGEIMISKHPAYILKTEEERMRWIPYFFGSNTDRNPINASYIEDKEYTYVITSFFGANTRQMHNICSKIVEMQLSDMVRERPYWIPRYIDENYFNKLVCDYEKGRSNEFTFAVDNYNTIYNMDSIDVPSVFMYQKNMKDYKFNRR